MVVVVVVVVKVVIVMQVGVRWVQRCWIMMMMMMMMIGGGGSGGSSSTTMIGTRRCCCRTRTNGTKGNQQLLGTIDILSIILVVGGDERGGNGISMNLFQVLGDEFSSEYLEG